ncbi:MAG: hypothetical protein JKY48_03065 [Flavobacteriales bacterium]|nr:hypothetical protein [Flavobacteriales bacterium]
MFDEGVIGQKSDSLHAKLIEPRFAVKDFDVQPQYINHWRKQDLFFNGEATRGKHPFSFVDYVWIRMIEKMKDIGLRFEVIRTVRDEMQSKPLWAKDDLDSIFDLLIQKKPDIFGTKDGRKKLEEKRIILHDQAEIQNYFSNLLAVAIANKSSLSFLINPLGEVIHLDPKREKDLFKNKQFISSFQSFYISISVTEIIQEFIGGEKRDIATNDLDLISKEEEAVLGHLEEDSLIKLIIETEEAEIDLFKENKEDAKDRFLDIITSEAYKRIVILNDRGTETKFLNPNQIELVHGELSEN